MQNDTHINTTKSEENNDNKEVKSAISAENEERIKQRLFNALTDDQKSKLNLMFERWNIKNDMGHIDVYGIEIKLIPGMMGVE